MAVMRRVGWVLAWSAMALSSASPALATHTAEHAAEQLDQIVAVAIEDMRSRVTEFEGEVQSASSASEIDSLRQAARSDVHDRWAAAEDEMEETAKGYQSEIGPHVATKKQELVGARNDGFADIDAAAAAAEGGLSPPTTTTTASPTTTQAAATTTITEPSVTTTTQGGGTPPPTGDPPPGDPPPSTQPSQLEIWAAQAFVPGVREPSSDVTPSSNGMVVALDTVLPRDLVDWAMSPFRIFWVIVRTTVEGGSDVLYPAAAFAASVVLLGLVEARFRHRGPSRRMGETG